MNVGIGLIGCGAMGIYLAKLLLAVDNRLQIKGIYDPDERSIKSAMDIASGTAKIYQDYHELLAAPDIDWVMIASWNCYHKEQVIASFESGKDVFCQKPLATNLEDCVSMFQVWKKSGKIFSIGYTLRYSPHYRKIKQLIDERMIGDIISLELNETLDFNHVDILWAIGVY